jgi:hypothetical protein
MAIGGAEDDREKGEAKRGRNYPSVKDGGGQNV